MKAKKRKRNSFKLFGKLNQSRIIWNYGGGNKELTFDKLSLKELKLFEKYSPELRKFCLNFTYYKLNITLTYSKSPTANPLYPCELKLKIKNLKRCKVDSAKKNIVFSLVKNEFFKTITNRVDHKLGNNSWLLKHTEYTNWGIPEALKFIAKLNGNVRLITVYFDPDALFSKNSSLVNRLRRL